jgi:hypothetical protein
LWGVILGERIGVLARDSCYTINLARVLLLLQGQDEDGNENLDRQSSGS